MLLIDGYGQQKERRATPKEQELWESSHDCAKTGNLSFSDRLKNYPFNIAKEIELVSFKMPVDPVWGDILKARLPRENDTICYSKLLEVKTITWAQVDSLTDILYNYGPKSVYKLKGKVYFIDTFLQCYYPRNAILFLDADKKVIEYIEICFECEKEKTSSDKIQLGPKCNQKYILLQNFFTQAGIEYVRDNESH